MLIQAGNVSEAVLEKDFKDIKGLFEQKERAGNRLVQLKQELEGLKSSMRKSTINMKNLILGIVWFVYVVTLIAH